MSQLIPVVMSWSGGKDSALALHELRRAQQYEVVALLTTVSEEYGRISHHGVREVLLEQQADALGIPLHKLYLPSNDNGPCTNSQYEGVMREAMLDYRARGVSTVAFGDIFLEDLRQYREQRLAEVDMTAIFPIWGQSTSDLVRQFVRDGFAARLSCVDAEKLGQAFAGRPLDDDLLRDLPGDVDPCGERGEYHSFVHDGPIFHRPVDLIVGQTVHRDVRYFTDLIPAETPQEQTNA